MLSVQMLPAHAAKVTRALYFYNMNLFPPNNANQKLLVIIHLKILLLFSTKKVNVVVLVERLLRAMLLIDMTAPMMLSAQLLPVHAAKVTKIFDLQYMLPPNNAFQKFLVILFYIQINQVFNVLNCNLLLFTTRKVYLVALVELVEKLPPALLFLPPLPLLPSTLCSEHQLSKLAFAKQLRKLTIFSMTKY